MKGLAVYDRELSAVEVSQSFVDWTEGSQLDSVKSENLVARYHFDEGNGNIVHNQVNSATDLLIPERFFVLHALGFAVSLTIEVLQSFLPTRDSGMTDLITNTFGTGL